MKKILTMLFWLVGLVAAPQMAAEIAFTPIEIPGSLTVPGFAYSYYTWTAPEDCIVKQTGCGQLDWFTKFAEDITEEDGRIPLQPIENVGSETQSVKKYRVVGGTQYFLYANFPWTASPVTFEIITGDDPGPEFISIEPAAGSAICNSTGGGILFLTMDANAEYDALSFTAGDVTTRSYAQGAHNAFRIVSLEIARAMQELYDRGVVPGAAITLNVEGLRSASTGVLYNGDGHLEVEYVLGEEAIALVSGDVTASTPFYSYYAVGDDRAKISYTFSKPFDPEHTIKLEESLTGTSGTQKVLSGPVLELACRTEENAYVKLYTGTYSNDNKTVTYDVSGTDFSDFNGSYMPGNMKSGSPAITLRNIYGLDGNMALGSDASSPGAYITLLNYKWYQPVQWVAEWTPEDDASLADTDEMKVVITSYLEPSDDTGVYDRIASFEGIEFVAPDGSQVAMVPQDQCTIVNAGDKKTITFATPQAAKTVQGVRAGLKGIVTVDGKQYFEETLQAYFNANPIPLTLDIDPTDGATLTSLESITVYTEGQYNYNVVPTIALEPAVSADVEFNTNFVPTISEPQAGYVLNLRQALGLTDEAGIKVARGTRVTITLPAGQFKREATGNVETVVTYVIDDEGEEPVDPEDPEDPEEPEPPTPTFHYSDVTLTAIAPEVGTTLELGQNTFTITFSAPVTLANTQILLAKNGEDQAEPIAVTWTPNDEGTQYTLTVDADVLDMSTILYMALYLQAEDETGGTLRGNGSGLDLEADSYYLFEYTVNSGADLIDIAVVPDFGTVAQIDVITLQGGDYEMPLEPADADGAYLLCGDEKIALAYSTDDNDYTVAYLTPAAPITEAGEYTLVVDERYVECTPVDGLGTYYNRALTGTYTIEATDGIANIVADANGEYVVYTIAGQQVMRADNAASLRALAPGLYIINGQKTLVR